MMHRLAVQLRYDGTVSFRDAYRSWVRVSRYVIAPGCPGRTFAVALVMSSRPA
jgi:hypothetical protein